MTLSLLFQEEKEALLFLYPGKADQSGADGKKKSKEEEIPIDAIIQNKVQNNEAKFKPVNINLMEDSLNSNMSNTYLKDENKLVNDKFEEILKHNVIVEEEENYNLINKSNEKIIHKAKDNKEDSSSRIDLIKDLKKK